MVYMSYNETKRKEAPKWASSISHHPKPHRIQGFRLFKQKGTMSRHLQVKVVKDSVAHVETDTNVADASYFVHETGKELLKGIGALMLTYVAADTVRKVIVHTAQTKIR